MSYQVLARKWRPANFDQVVGQSHVLHALTNALSQQRLHHAYLFTGTRGVGKTSLARLFAKGLNCETGVTANPCGQCASCIEIAQGRFVDLIEVDAASRTKVDDTRELLDNVQYRPTRGRFKVYLIDEVHMLSRSSFNALLKTLEEPPEHVKFLLATTDPQKLPVTVLSRCLQFNLKSLSQDDITRQLEHVLTEEQLSFEPQALTLLAKSANGSMRDALSLTDQAIAFGAGQVILSQVQTMLGTIDEQQVIALLGALLEGDVAQLMHLTAQILSYGADADEVLRSLLELLHQITLTQFAPAAAQMSLYAEQIKGFAAVLKPEQIQLYYQILLTGRKDLPHAPDPKSGLEMALLRAVAFLPEPVSGHWTPGAGGPHSPGKTEPAGGATGILTANATAQTVPQTVSESILPSDDSVPQQLQSTPDEIKREQQLSSRDSPPEDSTDRGPEKGADDPSVKSVTDISSAPVESQATIAQAEGQVLPVVADARDDVDDVALLAEQTLLLSQAQSLGYEHGEQTMTADEVPARSNIDHAGVSNSHPADLGESFAAQENLRRVDVLLPMACHQDDLASYEQYFMGDMDAEAQSLPVDMADMQFVPARASAPASVVSQPKPEISLEDDFLDAVLAARDSLLAGLQTDVVATSGEMQEPLTPASMSCAGDARRSIQPVVATHAVTDACDIGSDSKVVGQPRSIEGGDPLNAALLHSEHLTDVTGMCQEATDPSVDEDRPPWEDAPLAQVADIGTLPNTDNVFSAQFRTDDNSLSPQKPAFGSAIGSAPDSNLDAVSRPVCDIAQAVEVAQQIADGVSSRVLAVAAEVQGHELDLHWYKQMSGIKIGGRVRQLAVNSICLSWGEQVALLLKPDQKHLAAASAIEQLGVALGELACMELSIRVEVGQDENRETPREVRARFHQELLVAARAALHDDENIRWLTQVMGAQLDDDSVAYPSELLSIKGSSIPELGSQ
ncbi:MAG: DNA polymerase III subunit gamma/tau [Shewanella sp.]|nr:DNA polymerase III subunit gamma/tau [Shewanella sp.]